MDPPSATSYVRGGSNAVVIYLAKQKEIHTHAKEYPCRSNLVGDHFTSIILPLRRFPATFSW